MTLPHAYFRPWPPSGGSQLSLATILAGYLYPIPYNQKPLVLPTHDWPPGGALFFRFAPDTAARQIQQGTYPCRKIVFFAPIGNAASIYMGTQGVSVAGDTSMEIPPGSSGTIDISDVILIYFVAQNATDIITGWAESNL
jgi:hypothetical protein